MNGTWVYGALIAVFFGGLGLIGMYAQDHKKEGKADQSHKAK